jgi:hypothetical protein
MARWKSILGGLLAALLFLAVWVFWQPAFPPLDTADLYEHLATARHLVRDQGFRTDLAYPLSFAFPFARELPQPLIHRGPVFGLLLTAPYLAAGKDPTGTVAAVRVFQMALLGGLIWLGAWALLRRNRAADLLPWLILLGANPLLPFAVNWGFEELLAGLLMLAMWLGIRDGEIGGVRDGLLGGALALLRPELFWLPLLWWTWFAAERRRLMRGDAARPDQAFPWRKWAVAVAVLFLLQLPWAARNWQLTGSPVFTLQSQAELVKDTRTWPEYSVYRQLEPQPVGKVLTGDPAPVLRKTARGLKFFARETSKVVPLPYLVLGLLLVFGLLRGRVVDSPCPFRTGNRPLSILASDFSLGPLAAATATLLLLAAEYSLFDHSLRHLLPLLPVLAWEASALLGSALLSRLRGSPGIPGIARKPAAGFLVAALLTCLVVIISQRSTPGWDFSRDQARAQAVDLPARAARFAAAPADSLFADSSALTWYADRAAVWTPAGPRERERIRAYLQGTSGR